MSINIKMIMLWKNVKDIYECMRCFKNIEKKDIKLYVDNIWWFEKYVCFKKRIVKNINIL